MRDMLDQKLIEESTSPWNAPLFLVPKKDGSLRPVIDFRRLNNITVPEPYSLPVLNDLLQSIGSGNKVFSSLDLLSGYWQIPLHEDSREVTAFSTPSGHYHWLRTPMGLSYAPMTCMKLINKKFSGMLRENNFLSSWMIFW